jgi:hypothetical protein
MLAIGGLAYAAVRIGKTMWDDIAYERGGLENFQRRH